MSLKDRYQVNNVFVSAVTPENISRQQLLAWVNDSLQSNLTKIEEMSTGAAYCMLTDRLFPGSLQLQKVKWNVKSDLDSIANWKLVQNAWHELGITKPIHIQVLLKGKFQDNFEFLQWFKRFYDHNDAGYDYDPLTARNNEPFPSSTGLRSTKVLTTITRNPVSTTTASRRVTSILPTQNKSVTATTAPTRKSVAPRPATAVNAPKSALSVQQEAKYKNEIAELKDQISAWEKTLGSVENERDYYYEKLRKVELLCNEMDPDQTIKVGSILTILYKEEEEDNNDLEAFEAVEEKILHDTQTTEQSNGIHEENEELNTTITKSTEPNTGNIIDLDTAGEKLNVTETINESNGNLTETINETNGESVPESDKIEESKGEDSSIEFLGEVPPQEQTHPANVEQPATETN